jgi:RNA polymerase sigma factor (sigma-70 family)
MSQPHTVYAAHTAAIIADRPRLVRLCARLTGDWDAAEDLAQETLYEALRSLAKVHDAHGLPAWLTAIARNVCLRWSRRHGRERARRAPVAEASDALFDALPAEDDEPAILLERGELAALLDRALALLPAETRALLIATYVQGRSGADLAARTGLSEGAIRVRLHRGKFFLRRALATELREDAAALDIVAIGEAERPPANGWRETHIWCPFCGRHRLAALIDRETGEYAFRCAGRCQESITLVGGAIDTELLATLASPKSILARHCSRAYANYRAMLAERSAICGCGRPVPVRLWGDDDPPPSPLFLHGIYLACPSCGGRGNASPWHLSLDTPDALHFWRRHPRMRALPTREVEVENRPALLTGFESADSSARIELVTARDTYEVLRTSLQDVEVPA